MKYRLELEGKVIFLLHFCICSFSDKPQTRSGRTERHKVGGNASLNVGTQNGAGVHCCRPPVEATFGIMFRVVVNNSIEYYYYLGIVINDGLLVIRTVCFILGIFARAYKVIIG